MPIILPVKDQSKAPSVKYVKILLTDNMSEDMQRIIELILKDKKVPATLSSGFIEIPESLVDSTVKLLRKNLNPATFRKSDLLTLDKITANTARGNPQFENPEHENLVLVQCGNGKLTRGFYNMAHHRWESKTGRPLNSVISWKEIQS